MISLSDVKDNVKVVIDIASQFKNIELNQAILDLKNKLLDLQEEIISLHSENIELKQKFEKYNNSKMILRDGAYYELYNDKEKGPFCSVCWEKDNKTITLKKIRVGWSSQEEDHTYLVDSCPVCRTRRDNN
jgi:hypothetical protein